MNALMRASASSLMFKPPPRRNFNTFRTDAENVLLKSIQGEYIHCCLVCPYGLETSLQTMPARPETQTEKVAIFMHGNADDVASCKSYGKWLADHLKMKVVLMDYPGYGYSSGEPSEEGMEHAALAVMEYVTCKLGFHASNVFLIGKSIGSYPAVSLAAHPAFSRYICGLVLISPVASAARCVLDAKYVPDFLLRRLDGIALSNILHVGRVETQMFIVHGSADEIVSVDNAHALIAHAGAETYYPPLFLEAGHNDIESKFQSVMLEALEAFVGECSQRESKLLAHSPYDGFF